MSDRHLRQRYPDAYKLPLAGGNGVDAADGEEFLAGWFYGGFPITISFAMSLLVLSPPRSRQAGKFRLMRLEQGWSPTDYFIPRQ